MANLKNDEQKSLQYELHEKIGKGSFGIVYRATEAKTSLVVAIKVMNMEEIDTDLEEISKEISFLGTCNSPYITKYFASFSVDKDLWIVMEYLGGGSVLDLLQMGPMDEKYSQIIIKDLLQGLNYLHNQHKIHRDIKSPNILLSCKGEVKIADFGVAGKLTKTIDKRNTFVGSLFWMAPEIIQGSDYGTAVDIWSAGIVCIEMCDGKPPYDDQNQFQVLTKIVKNNSPEPRNKKISENFKKFIAECLIKSADLRPDAKRLLKHPFLKQTKKNSHLISLINEYKSYMQDRGPETSDDDMDNDEMQARVKKAKKPGDNINWLFDTLRLVDREMVQSMVNDVNISTFDSDSKDKKNLKDSDASKMEPVHRDAKNTDDGDGKNEGSKKLESVLNELVPLHSSCDSEIKELIQLVTHNNFNPFIDEFRKFVTQLDPRQ